jgi:tetratricopeptide (TPR) repeat protein
VKDLPDHAPARRVITLIVTTSFEAVLADDALYRKIEPAVMADVLKRFADIDKKLDQLNETVRLFYLRAENAAERRHAKMMAAIAREKGVEPKHLAVLFEAVGHEQNLSLDAYESAIRTAVETLLKRARDPIAPSNDAPAVEAAIAAAREQLSRLDSVGAIETLRAARRRQQDAQAELKRGEARLAGEEGDILAAAYRRSEAIVAYQTAIDLDPDRLQAYCNIGTVHATEGRRVDAMAAFERFREAAHRLGDERETYVSLIEIGDLRVAEGDRPGALDAYQKGLEIGKTLAARDPANAGWQRDLIISNVKLAEMKDDSVSRYSEALRIANALQSSTRHAPVNSPMVDELARLLAAAKAARP